MCINTVYISSSSLLLNTLKARLSSSTGTNSTYMLLNHKITKNLWKIHKMLEFHNKYIDKTKNLEIEKYIFSRVKYISSVLNTKSF